jgi:hypothetical protein
MEILASGTIAIVSDCVVFSVADMQYVMVWPEHRTTWDGESIVFSTLSGDTVEIRADDEVEATGGPLRSDTLEVIDWVNAPSPACAPTQGWRVYDIEI